jgi:hypothetical protein
VVSASDPYGCILSFLDRNRWFFFLNCTHEAECTPFQSHYLLETLVVLGIEPGTSRSVARNSDQTTEVVTSTKDENDYVKNSF